MYDRFLKHWIDVDEKRMITVQRLNLEAAFTFTNHLITNECMVGEKYTPSTLNFNYSDGIEKMMQELLVYHIFVYFFEKKRSY